MELDRVCSLRQGERVIILTHMPGRNTCPHQSPTMNVALCRGIPPVSQGEFPSLGNSAGFNPGGTAKGHLIMPELCIIAPMLRPVFQKTGSIGTGCTFRVSFLRRGVCSEGDMWNEDPSTCAYGSAPQYPGECPGLLLSG
jgi:hypothetical protein